MNKAALHFALCMSVLWQMLALRGTPILKTSLPTLWRQWSHEWANSIGQLNQFSELDNGTSATASLRCDTAFRAKFTCCHIQWIFIQQLLLYQRPSEIFLWIHKALHLFAYCHRKPWRQWSMMCRSLTVQTLQNVCSHKLFLCTLRTHETNVAPISDVTWMYLQCCYY